MRSLINLIPIAHAQIETEFGPASNAAQYLSLILAWLIPIMGGIALLTFIYAGILYITSQGTPEKINQAKEIIIVTITGLALLFLARLILVEIGII